jgi:hypothetical protein
MQRQTIAVLGIALVLLATLGSAGAVMALADGSSSPQSLQTTDSTDRRSITVSANGQAEAQPDKAVLRLSVEATSPDATTARTQVAENVSAVKTALAELGIEEDQIRTTDYRIYRDDRRPEPGMEEQPEPVFRARHTLSIDIDDVDAVGQVIDAAVDAGATDIHNVQFTLSTETRQELRNEALTAAMDNARGQADTLAQSADLSITGVHDVSTTDYSGPVYRYETAMAAGGSGGTDISSGPVTVNAQVTVTYNASG